MPRKNRKRTVPEVTDPRWRSPAPPAPGDLRIVQAFLSTAPAWRQSEVLVDSEALIGWLELWELVPPGTDIRREQVKRMLTVRESLRAFLRARTGKAAPRAAKALEIEAQQTRARTHFDAGGNIRYVAESEGFEGALARIFDAVNSAQRDGSWKRLKLCADPRCGRAFYDYSPNLGGKWCHPNCGYRKSTAMYRRRHPHLYFPS
jgi:predicted RNA-binding Zn ribbon-like protein